MNIRDHSFHDAALLAVKEITEYQVLEMLLDFPVDWENNVFEHKTLRFTDVTRYSVNEIPWEGDIIILEIKELAAITTKIGFGRNEMSFKRNREEIITNAGNRFIDYTECTLL